MNDIAIIGAGPAGLAVALQLKRYGLSPLLLEGGRVGGLLWNANLVENYPGFPGGIPGPALVRLFERGAKNAAVEVTHEEVTGLGYQDGVFHLQTRKRDYRARIAVVASGTKARTFLSGLIPAGLGDRVFYEVYPLLGQEGRHILIAGAGDAAFDYALNLAKKNTVGILNRGDRVKCLPLLWERAMASPRIEYYQNTEITRLFGAPGGKIAVECMGLTGASVFQADYLLGAIGREPRLDFISPALRRQADELQAGGALYFIGDVVNGLCRQAAIAVGNGIQAAMEIYRRL